jgi:hypothetical protein
VSDGWLLIVQRQFSNSTFAAFTLTRVLPKSMFLKMVFGVLTVS